MISIQLHQHWLHPEDPVVHPRDRLAVSCQLHERARLLEQSSERTGLYVQVRRFHWAHPSNLNQSHQEAGSPSHLFQLRALQASFRSTIRRIQLPSKRRTVATSFRGSKAMCLVLEAFVRQLRQTRNSNSPPPRRPWACGLVLIQSGTPSAKVCPEFHFCQLTCQLKWSTKCITLQTWLSQLMFLKKNCCW